MNKIIFIYFNSKHIILSLSFSPTVADYISIDIPIKQEFVHIRR